MSITQTAHHTAAATNGIADVAGHIAKLRDLNESPNADARYRAALDALGAASIAIRAAAGETTKGEAA